MNKEVLYVVQVWVRYFWYTPKIEDCDGYSHLMTYYAYVDALQTAAQYECLGMKVRVVMQVEL